MSWAEKKPISFFEKYLTLWVALCIVVGTLIGRFLPAVPEFLSTLEYARVSIPVAILIWLMIYPMMLKIDFNQYRECHQKAEGADCYHRNQLAHKALYHVSYRLFFS